MLWTGRQEGSEFESQWDQEFFLLHVIETSLSSGNWGLFPQRQSVQVVKLTIHLQLVPKARTVDLYNYSPIHLLGIVLN
jgi:hypothetical protein